MPPGASFSRDTFDKLFAARQDFLLEANRCDCDLMSARVGAEGIDFSDVLD